MRDIKFRGFSISKKKWVYGNYNYTFERGYFSQGYDDVPERCFYIDTDTNYYEVYSQTIGQYTGLKDKNNKEIYEGDIIQFTWYEDSCWGKAGTYKGYIRFNEGIFEVVYIDKIIREYSSPENSKSDDIKSFFDWSEDIKIIGNIYENPELLEVR